MSEHTFNPAERRPSSEPPVYPGLLGATGSTEWLQHIPRREWNVIEVRYVPPHVWDWLRSDASEVEAP